MSGSAGFIFIGVINVIEIGCVARYFYSYEHEVKFAKENKFAFLQIWYDRDGLLHKNVEQQTHIIRQFNYPAIIHAVLDINEMDEHVPRLLQVLKTLGHKQLIVHPVCKSERIVENTIYKLADKVKVALDMLTNEGIILYLENNSKLDPIFTSSGEIEIMFDRNPNLEFLLDVAHIDNYTHLKEMIDIKRPKILHIADRHLEVIHEHLPLGQGNINYEYVFKNILKSYEGKIILEVSQSDEDIINSRNIIERYTIDEV